eukprot:378316-Rhodomonas_salina.1
MQDSHLLHKVQRRDGAAAAREDRDAIIASPRYAAALAADDDDDDDDDDGGAGEDLITADKNYKDVYRDLFVLNANNVLHHLFRVMVEDRADQHMAEYALHPDEDDEEALRAYNSYWRAVYEETLPVCA